MRHLLITALLLLVTSYVYAEPAGGGSESSEQAEVSAPSLADKKWIHGAADCSSNSDPAIDVFQQDATSYILRQNKCLNFEAPFIYVLIGEDTALVLDTGATESASEFPLYETVQSLISQASQQTGRATPAILVIHSHSHGDHYRGDTQFAGKPNVTLVPPKRAAMMEFFDFKQWPVGVATVDLGNRILTILPAPGHQEEAIAVYDPQTQWLLTGDTFYPGYIYVKRWEDYQQSIDRLATFASTNDVSAVLGAHIEMSGQAGQYYPIGTSYQPDEAPLILTTENLVALNLALKQTDKPTTIETDNFIVAPMGGVQKMLSNMARWLTQ